MFFPRFSSRCDRFLALRRLREGRVQRCRGLASRRLEEASQYKPLQTEMLLYSQHNILLYYRECLHFHLLALTHVVKPARIESSAGFVFVNRRR